MAVMAVVGAVLLLGIVLTVRWSGTEYVTWDPEDGRASRRPPDEPGDEAAPPSVRVAALRYLRGVAVALVGGFWAGALVTGPAVRLVMRLLAVTGGDAAQGRITEADEVVGDIDVGGTIALEIFGGILPGLLSGVIYVVCRRWLPAGRLGGLVFGALHLVVAATRIDPLRPDNADFDIVGPGWLSVLAFAVVALVHGVAVVAIANRYSHAVPPAGERGARARAVLPLLLPGLVTLLVIPADVAIALGLVITVVATRFTSVVRAASSRAVIVGGRVVAGLAVVALLPGMVADLHDVIVREDDSLVTDRG